MCKLITMQDFIKEMKKEEEYLKDVNITVYKHKVNQEAKKLAEWFDEIILEEYLK